MTFDQIVFFPAKKRQDLDRTKNDVLPGLCIFFIWRFSEFDDFYGFIL